MPIRVDYAGAAARIRQYRLAAGLTQRQLSERIGKSDSWVQLVENGCRRLTLDTLIALCYELDVSANKLLIDSLPEDLFGETTECVRARFRPKPGKLRNTLSNWVLVDTPDESLSEEEDPLSAPADLEHLPPPGFVGLDEPMPEPRYTLHYRRLPDGSLDFRRERKPRGGKD